MPETDMNAIISSDLANALSDYTIAPVSTDAAGDQVEFTWQSVTWPSYYGYYRKIPELKTAIDTKVRWTVGAGFSTDEPTEMLLSAIKGNGKDTFLSILSNGVRVKIIDGDSFAEIIVDGDVIVNLKPLAPDSMVIVQNSRGQIVRYEQVSKVKGNGSRSVKKFAPNKIFHLSRERVADEIHGLSVIESVKWIIDARNEAMTDWRRVLHRHVDPLFIFHLDTDDPATISKVKSTQDKARGAGENIYVPKGAVVPELLAVAGNSSLNPLAWIDKLNDYFFQTVNVPQIITGNAKEFTDASGKIVYLSYEQSVKAEQLYIEEQVLAQLNFEITLNFPASLQQELISSREKDSDLQAAAPNDVVEELEGQT